jgi:hypothetical protein
VPVLLAEIEVHLGSSSAASSSSSPPGPQPDDSQPQVNVLDLVLVLLEKHVALTSEQRMAVALWILHTHVYEQFPISPRLALLSPVRGCGKTTLLILLEQLVAQPYRTDNTSAAAPYYLLDRRPHALLVDEVENLALRRHDVLRAVFDAGHRRGGAITRFVGGFSKRLAVYSPLAVAAIGRLPLPLQHRSITIHMKRFGPGDAQIQRLDESDPAFRASKIEIEKWARICKLNNDPKIPKGIANRAADNWRVLLAIADSLGHGEDARAAAITLNAGRQDEDSQIVLLRDIRDLFKGWKVDRIASADLVDALIALETGLWHDWRGIDDNRPPRKLTQSELGHLLSDFEIRARVVWPVRRRSDSKSRRGYYRADLEKAWSAYLDSGVTPSHPGATKSLDKPPS